MTITVELLDNNRTILVDDRTAELGGSFWNNPHLMPYSPLPLRWCFDRLLIYPKVTLLDIGASTGCFSLLSRWHADMTVHAFEPVDMTYRVLCENVYLNGLEEKVIVNECAVSDYNGEGILHEVVSDGGKGVSIVGGNVAWHKHTIQRKVEVITVDTYCSLHNVVPHFIKVDVEGAEELVLRGAKETIEKYHPFLLFEYSQENADQFGLTARKTIELIEEWGYTWTCDGLDVYGVPKGWEELIK